MSRVSKLVLVVAGMLFLVPAAADAQDGSIAGVVKDASDAILPGVTVEVTSPALIEKVRSTITDGNGQYRIAALPIGTYVVTLSLASFSTVRRENIVLSSGFTASVDVVMSVGQINETLVVQGVAPTIDVQTARQVTVFTGDELKDLPTSRNVSSIMHLVPGITLQTGVFNESGGVCVGGAGIWCSPNAYGFNAHTSTLDADGLRQGRLLVDGMVLNTASNPVTGAAGGYIADVTNAQEITFNLSGALGESETGGTSINIIPRTGGNKFAGNYFTSYTTKAWFDRNDGTHKGTPTNPAAQSQHIIHDHDISGAYGGPIRRDRLWFYSVVRTQGKEANQGSGPLWYNKHAGKWGANYQPDRTRPPLTYTNKWSNANARITWQATQRNKFGIFWDEQDSCQDPCNGTVSGSWSPEAMWSIQTNPNRVAQISWTNPRTNRLLFEAGLNIVTQLYNFTEHRYLTNPQGIPQITENGVTAGGDEVSPRVNPTAGAGFSGLRSGSIYSSNRDSLDNYRTRASAS